jgi:hypothetical protein
MNMADQISKEQILETTINVLSNISVPVRMREITEKIDGAINNLLIVQQLLKMEAEMNTQPEAETEIDVQPQAEDDNG